MTEVVSARTSSRLASAVETAAIGPVAFCALLFLLVAAPLMRGGNRHVALVVLEAAALLFLAAIVYRLPATLRRPSPREALLALVCLSPAWLAIVYLLPLPGDTWGTLAGRSEYLRYMTGAGVAMPDSLALSLVPAATKSSLLAGIPIAAAFVAGLLCTFRQFRIVCMVLVGLGVFQTVVGMLQMAGGHNSALFAGMAGGGRPVGTFANPNHLANYVAMTLSALVWLAWSASVDAGEAGPKNISEFHRARRKKLLWIAGAVLLVVGVLMSRSRGATLSGLATALGAILLVRTVAAGRSTWKRSLFIVLIAVVAGVGLVGWDALMSRFDVASMVASAPSRTIQAATTLEGARHFWPWGSGWGTYAAVYPRFQPAALVGTADYAHQDYAQMLFEGGIFAAGLIGATGWLLTARAVALVRAGLRRRRLRTEEIAAAICGLGLLGFLLHSFVEFNMHIPANAILAALLAGAYLRPLKSRGSDGEHPK